MSKRPELKHRKSLSADLYSPAQVLAADGLLPADHEAWNLNERSEAKYIASLGTAPLPEFAPPGRQQGDERTVRGSCDCGAAWRGELACHCPTCHLTFRSVTGFDDHRVGGRCRTTDELAKRGFEPNAEGHWRRPRPIETLPNHVPTTD